MYNVKCTCWKCSAINLTGKLDFRVYWQPENPNVAQQLAGRMGETGNVWNKKIRE
jgi:hypothetical protein